MQDEDLDALAAEYVLGTLSAEERGQAEALSRVDPGFSDIVRHWERRLGELNVMVEAVEPATDVWDKIKAEIDTLAASEEVRLAPIDSPEPLKTEAEASAETKAEATVGGEKNPLLAALASTLLEGEAQAKSGGEPDVKSDTKPSGDTAARPSLPIPNRRPERAATPRNGAAAGAGADVFYLAHRLRRWRLIAMGAGALALLFAVIIVLSQAAPQLFPAGQWHVPQLFAGTPAATDAAPTSRLVAVLQRDPTAPAFLLTVDAATRTVTVRRVSAVPQAGRAFELWMLPSESGKPQSLGLVGADEFTQRALPSGSDVTAMQAASYEISFERTGGSQTGAPSGPILFTGKPVESVQLTPTPHS